MEQDLFDDFGTLAIPKGAEVRIGVRKASHDAKPGQAELVLAIHSIKAKGRRYKFLMPTPHDRSVKVIAGRDVLRGVLSPLPGGPVLAEIVIAATKEKGQRIHIPAQTLVTLRLTQHLRVQIKH